MTVTLYGIKNCDTVKKARDWLNAHSVAYIFHDYKASGIDRHRLTAWCKELGWEVVLNRAGTTFRGLPNADKADLNQAKAITLMLSHMSLIKRPILDVGPRRLVGFKPDAYAAVFAG